MKMPEGKEILVEISRNRTDGGAKAELWLPANAWELEDALDRARIAVSSDCRVEIKQMPNFRKERILPASNLDGLNFLAQRLAGLDKSEKGLLEGLAKIQNPHGMMQVDEIINLTYNLDICCIADGVGTDEALGKLAVETGMVEAPEYLVSLLDFAKVGKEQRENENGVYVQNCYVMCGSELEQRYGGIPMPLEAMPHTIELDLRGPHGEETLRLPCSRDVLWEKLLDLGKINLADCEVTACRCRVPIDSQQLCDINRISDVNELADVLAKMDAKDLLKYKALLERKEPHDLGTLLTMTRELNQYELQTDLDETPAGYARAFLKQKLGAQEALELESHADMESYGISLIRRGRVPYTSYGLLHEQGQSFDHLETLKFYSPLLILQEPRDEYGDLRNGDYEPIDPDFDILSCTDAIRSSLERENRRLDTIRGLMEYYGMQDALPSLTEKVQSLFFGIEEHSSTLWGVTEAKILTQLTEEETAGLLDYAEAQMSDGFGEGWEQRPIKTPEGEIHVSLWNPDNFQMIPEAEFDPEQFMNYDYSGGMKF